MPREADSIAVSKTFDVYKVREDFPILGRTVHDRPGKLGHPLVFLDSGASAQKPRQVIAAMDRLMNEDYANVHRGVHYLSQRATDAFEAARVTVAKFLNAASDNEIVFTRNATEAINLVAATWGRKNLRQGDEIILSVMEHHANIVPWQLLQAETGIVLKPVGLLPNGALDLDAYADAFSDRTKLVAMTHCSNVLGTLTPAKELAAIAHAKGVPVLFDGSQAVVHGVVDVRDIDADFYVFTGHKLYGPTGIGVLYGKYGILKTMPPYQGGGDMIEAVSFAGTTFKAPPARFEAGTPAIVEAVGLAAAIDWVNGVGREAMAAHEQNLLAYATAKLEAIDGVKIYGHAPHKGPIISFTLDGVHPHDIGTVVDQCGVAIRVGRHCAEPLMEWLDVGATARASLACYNTIEEMDALVQSVITVKEFFG